VKTAKRVLTPPRLRDAAVALALIALPAASVPAVAGAATPGPAWSISTSSTSPTVFTPGDSSGNNLYTIEVMNSGSKASDPSKPIVITDFLPPGLSLNPSPSIQASLVAYDGGEKESFPCDPPPAVRCTFATTVNPGQKLYVRVPVNIAANAPSTVTNQATVTGGGASGASASYATPVSAAQPDFQYFDGSLLDAGGGAETRAGAHPYQFRIAAQFNTSSPNGLPVESPKDIIAALPAGLVINPAATVHCTEVQLETVITTSNGFESQCPNASAVGLAHVTLTLTSFATLGVAQPVYNMFHSQGRPAEFAFNVGGFGVFIHLQGRVRSDGDFGLSSDSLDAPQYKNPSGVSIELWGDPSDPGHDFVRGNCAIQSNFGKSCPVTSNHSAARARSPSASAPTPGRTPAPLSPPAPRPRTPPATRSA